MSTSYFVMWDNSNGIDWEEMFQNLAQALRFYNNLPDSVPYKKILLTDEDGDKTVLTSKGENNIDALGLRCYVW